MKKYTLLTALFFVACSTYSDWILAPSQQLAVSTGWREVPYCEPQENLISDYLARLESATYLKIGLDEFYKLCGSVKKEGIETAFIVRALYIGKYTGDYIVRKKAESIWVNHESLASKSTKPTKSAVILFLDQPPSNLFVTAYADE
jgi:hypothetical protein